MAISAKVIADSRYFNGPRLTTFVLKYPRFIHSEFMTHRVFSRNASSSRAIPVAKMIQAVKDDPAMPVYWGKNIPGMQAAEELSAPEIEDMKGFWISARNEAIRHAEEMVSRGLHKQIANRILEPWMHIEVVVTATDWDNFYALRNHSMAQPEIQELARKMLEAHNNSTPEALLPGQWHLPFIEEDDLGMLVHYSITSEKDDPTLFAKVSAARCARVSYLNHEGNKTTIEEDLNLYTRLMGGEIKHASPTEHQAMVPTLNQTLNNRYPKSNLLGWIQHRKMIDGETQWEYSELIK
jgi:thymidylate synthase ThyX